MSEVTLSIHFVRAALVGARRQGLAAEPLLARSGIPVTLLADPLARVTAQQYTRLVQVLWDTLDDEYMGFGPVRSPRGSFATMGLLTVHCPDLASALRRARSFYQLFPNAPEGRLVDAGEIARFELRTDGFDDPDHFMVESLLVLWHRFASWLIGHRIPLQRTDFRYPAPPHVAEYPLMFGCKPNFAQPSTALSFHRRYLELPVVQDEASLRRFLRHSPADLFPRRDYQPSLTEQVRRIVGRAPGNSGPTPEAVASRLDVSEATLRRKLRAEGTSFREVRDHLLRDEAVASLVRGAETVEELALRLGFSDASAFHRAFKRWTGSNPGAYRGERSTPAPTAP